MSPALAFLLLGLCADGPRPAPTPPPSGPAEADETRYPLGTLPLPDFAGPGEPFRLVDLRYGLSDTLGTSHSFSARLKVRDWGHLTAGFEGERRDLILSLQRLDLVASAEGDGVYDLFGRYRAPWLLVSAEARRRSAAEGRGWRLGWSLAGRLSPSFELVGSVNGETRAPDDRFLRFASLGFLWQPGARFEASGGFEHQRVSTEAGLDNLLDAGLLSVVGLVRGAELSGGMRLDRVRGRLPRREVETTFAARLPLAARLLAEGGARARFEPGVNKRSHEYRGGLTWFGRRFHLPRTGEAAGRAVELARRATRLGYNERLAFDDASRRGLRERLSLSARRDELVEEMAALYSAQVRERALPLLGFDLMDAVDALSGVTTRSLRAFVGVPWPPSWPWRANEPAVPFLRLDLERRRQLSGPAFEAVTGGVALTAALNREMDLVVRWSRSEPTALDVIRGVGPRRTFEVAYVYAFGR